MSYFNSKIYKSNKDNLSELKKQNNLPNNYIKRETMAQQNHDIDDYYEAENNILKNTTKYKRYKQCDCDGNFMGKFKCPKFFSQLIYVPLWFSLLTTTIFAASVGSILYLAITYQYSATLLTYTNDCSGATTLCSTDKYLYCRVNNRTTTDYCNCPAPSNAYMCGKLINLYKVEELSLYNKFRNIPSSKRIKYSF